MRSQTIRSLLLFLSVEGCASTSIYPKEGFVLDSLPEREPHEVQVYDDGEVPSCPRRDIATISYDAYRDGKRTSKDVARAGLKEQAAKLGAHGIYNFKWDASGVSGHNATLLNMTSGSSFIEYSGEATAFICITPKAENKLSANRADNPARLERAEQAPTSKTKYPKGRKVASTDSSFFPQSGPSPDVESLSKPSRLIKEESAQPGYYPEQSKGSTPQSGVDADAGASYSRAKKLRNIGIGLTIPGAILFPLGAGLFTAGAACDYCSDVLTTTGMSISMLSTFALLPAGITLWAVGSSRMKRAQAAGYTPVRNASNILQLGVTESSLRGVSFQF